MYDEYARQARCARMGFGYELRSIAIEYADKPIEDEVIDEIIADALAIRHLEEFSAYNRDKAERR